MNAAHSGAEVRVYRTASADNFTVVANAMLRNELPVPLSAIARMVLLHLLSLPTQGWRTDRDRLARSFTEGVGQIRRAFTELTAAGYFQRTRGHEPDGTFIWNWDVSDQPIFATEPVDNPERPPVSAGRTTGRNPANGPSASLDAFSQVGPWVENQPMVNQPMVPRPPATSLIERKKTPTTARRAAPPPEQPPPPSSSSDDTGHEAALGAVLDDLAALPGRIRPNRGTLKRMTPLLRRRIETGWLPADLVAELAGGLQSPGVASPVGLMVTRLAGLDVTPPEHLPGAALQAWCHNEAQTGCMEGYRWYETADGKLVKCHCHTGYGR